MLPPTPGPASPPPGVTTNSALGRYSGQQTDAQNGPDLAARQAYAEATGAGRDGTVAAKEAWKASVAALSQRLNQPGYQPANPGEANLVTVAKRLQQQGLDPVAATAMAHEFLAAQAIADRQKAPAPPGAPA